MSELNQDLSESSQDDTKTKATMAKFGASSPNTAIAKPNLTTTNTKSAFPQITGFNSLPRELRDEIWDRAIPDPQVVDVYVIDIDREYLQEEGEDLSIRLILRTQRRYEVPNLLHINREARSIALQAYRPIFPLDIHEIPIYFSIRDTLYTDTTSMRTLYQHNIVYSDVQNLILNDRFEDNCSWVCCLLHESFPRLENLTMATREFSTQLDGWLW